MKCQCGQMISAMDVRLGRDLCGKCWRKRNLHGKTQKEKKKKKGK